MVFFQHSRLVWIAKQTEVVRLDVSVRAAVLIVEAHLLVHPPQVQHKCWNTNRMGTATGNNNKINLIIVWVALYTYLLKIYLSWFALTTFWRFPRHKLLEKKPMRGMTCCSSSRKTACPNCTWHERRPEQSKSLIDKKRLMDWLIEKKVPNEYD